MSIKSWIDRLIRAFSPSELRQIDPQQVDEIARDVGVTALELMTMTSLGPNAAAQLPQRMRALDLDSEKIKSTDWAALRDMQRVCSVCGSKWQCEKDLRNPDDPKWQEYCPNAETLRGIANR